MSPQEEIIRCLDCSKPLEKIYFEKTVIGAVIAYTRYSLGNRSEFLGFVCNDCHFKNEPCADEDCPTGDRRNCPQKLSDQCDICTDEFLDWLEKGE